MVLTSGRRRRFAGFSAVACAVLAVGAIAALTPWQDDSSAPVAPGPTLAAGPTLDPKYAGTMIITPATAAPGAEIDLTFPDAEYVRGVPFTLASPADGKVLYYLFNGRPGKSTWSSAADPNGQRPSSEAGIKGHGPDRLVVPDTAADGTYLLCTVDVRDEACALLTVAR
jgi:hypothetical protein